MVLYGRMLMKAVHGTRQYEISATLLICVFNYLILVDTFLYEIYPIQAAIHKSDIDTDNKALPRI